MNKYSGRSLHGEGAAITQRRGGISEKERFGQFYTLKSSKEKNQIAPKEYPQKYSEIYTTSQITVVSIP